MEGVDVVSLDKVQFGSGKDIEDTLNIDSVICDIDGIISQVNLIQSA